LLKKPSHPDLKLSTRKNAQKPARVQPQRIPETFLKIPSFSAYFRVFSAHILPFSLHNVPHTTRKAPYFF
jgi:hypothetical protein